MPSIPLFLFSLLVLPSSLSSAAVSEVVVLRPNATLFSPNRTFQLSFVSFNPHLPHLYLAVSYASLPTPTFVWVANRLSPVTEPSSAALLASSDGRVLISDAVKFSVWQSQNPPLNPPVNAVDLKLRLLESGNLVLISPKGEILWQSFDYPTDTWLPGMNLTAEMSLTSWRSQWDPSPGRFSLRLNPVSYGEFELVYRNGSKYVSYWSTGKWTGETFINVPEMTVPYIYKFHFNEPFTETASFGFTETPLENGVRPPLSRFHVDFSGQLRQYTWSPQIENWNMFWSQPENRCRVYGLCGTMGVCYGGTTRICGCFNGFDPVDRFAWDAGDFSAGCRKINAGDGCDGGRDDGFEEVGVVSFDGGETVSFQGSNMQICERNCLSNCSCIGLYYNQKYSLCKNLYGDLINIRNLSSHNTLNDVLYLRVEKSVMKKAQKWKKNAVICGTIGGFVLILVGFVFLIVIIKKIRRRRREKEEEILAVTNLKVFSYKELHVATRGFSEKVGHGGFGTVFRGVLPDSSLVAVKRLERPGGGEREFRAEVCTIGNVQHVNLVRLRGFCSENLHRLLVYDYMHNGSLSCYLKRDGEILSWDVRFRVAIGTAKALAYLHEECRDCIIHCDIKPENILLDGDYVAKVSDFGLAKLMGRDFSRVLVTMRGTWGYVAPEWISGVAITSKADVYSYGMTLLELLGGRRNVETPPDGAGNGGSGDGGGGEKWFFPPWAAQRIIEGDVGAVVDRRLGGEYDKVEAKRLGMVAVWCIQDEEVVRPAMGMVVKMLEGVVEVAVPPPPKLLQALVSGESFRGVVADSGEGGGSGVSDVDIRVSRYSPCSSISSSPDNASLHRSTSV